MRLRGGCVLHLDLVGGGMSAKHTPGPWAQATLSPSDVVTDADAMIATARDGMNGISRDQAIANARLIATAPTMLDALRELTIAAEAAGWDIDADNAPILAAARAAIARATGEA
jgi:hypothetical protein